MIELPQPTETLLLNAAKLAGDSPIHLLDRLLYEFIEDQRDAKIAEQAYFEFIDSGEAAIPFEKVLSDNGL